MAETVTPICSNIQWKIDMSWGALYQENETFLNIQEKSVKFELFNYRLFQKHVLVKAFVKWKPANSFALYIYWLVTT